MTCFASVGTVAISQPTRRHNLEPLLIHKFDFSRDDSIAPKIVYTFTTSKNLRSMHVVQGPGAWQLHVAHSNTRYAGTECDVISRLVVYFHSLGNPKNSVHCIDSSGYSY